MTFLPHLASESDLIPSLSADVALDCLLRTPLPCHSTLQQVCRAWKSVLSCPSFCHLRQLSGYAHDCACFVQASCGSVPFGPGKSPVYGVTVYNAKLESWDRLPPIPDSPDGLPLFCQCVSVAGSVVLLGGWNPVSWVVLKCVYIFSFSTGQWRRGADMGCMRSFFACGSVGGRIIVAGGHDDNKNALRSAEMYDLDRDVWEPLPDMRQERDECKGAVVDGKFLAISGFSTDSQGQFCRSAESFDFSAHSWEPIDNMWPASRSLSSIVSLKGQLYAVQESKLMRYKWKESQWEAVATLPDSIKMAACATVLGETILISGFNGGAQSYETFVYKAHASVLPLTSGQWQKVETGEDFCGLIQGACTVEL